MARPKAVLESVPASSEAYEAERLYYLHEIARSQDDGDRERQILSDMMQKFPASPFCAPSVRSLVVSISPYWKTFELRCRGQK